MPAGDRDTAIEVIPLQALIARKHTFDHDPEQPHRVEFNLLIVFESGQGVHFLDFQEIPFEAGTALLVQRNQIHAFDFSQNPSGKIILFTHQFIQQIQQHMRFSFFEPAPFRSTTVALSLSKDLEQSYVRLSEEMIKEIQHSGGNSIVAMHLFVSLLLLLKRELPAQASSRLNEQHQKLLMRFFELLESHVLVSRNAAEYAGKLRTTYKTLNRVCKLETNQTAKQLIDAYTVLEAKRRIAVDNSPIQVIADELGFDELTNFVKYFKKHTSMTPTQFKLK